jgi:hypothetical protein
VYLKPGFRRVFPPQKPKQKPEKPREKPQKPKTKKQQNPKLLVFANPASRGKSGDFVGKSPNRKQNMRHS